MLGLVSVAAPMAADVVEKMLLAAGVAALAWALLALELPVLVAAGAEFAVVALLCHQTRWQGGRHCS